MHYRNDGQAKLFVKFNAARVSNFRPQMAARIAGWCDVLPARLTQICTTDWEKRLSSVRARRNRTAPGAHSATRSCPLSSAGGRSSGRSVLFYSLAVAEPIESTLHSPVRHLCCSCHCPLSLCPDDELRNETIFARSTRRPLANCDVINARLSSASAFGNATLATF